MLPADRARRSARLSWRAMRLVDRKERETEFARFLTFSDGVFAIAITLLALNIEVPRLPSGHRLGAPLFSQWPDILAYLVSFAVVGRFWLIHHRLFTVVS